MNYFSCSGCGQPCDVTFGYIDGIRCVVSDCTCRDSYDQPVGAISLDGSLSPRQALACPEVEAGYARIGEEPSWAYDDDEPGPEPSEWDEWRADDARERQRDFDACQGGY